MSNMEFSRYRKNYGNIFFFFLQCNTPQTKEPKLERAIRIAPEWTEYDDVIRKLQEQMNSEEITKSSNGKSSKKILAPTKFK